MALPETITDFTSMNPKTTFTSWIKYAPLYKLFCIITLPFSSKSLYVPHSAPSGKNEQHKADFLKFYNDPHTLFLKDIQ